ncbi:MAG: hypothetical protein HKO69_00570, partial [Woeseiaceae bacterium]|nr:hypothetical protein [Woeseiaceae bacterium]
MDRKTRERIRAATEDSAITKTGFVELLNQFEAKCDKSDTTLSESLRQQLQTPIEAIFDSITDALLTTARD